MNSSITFQRLNSFNLAFREMHCDSAETFGTILSFKINEVFVFWHSGDRVSPTVTQRICQNHRPQNESILGAVVLWLSDVAIFATSQPIAISSRILEKADRAGSLTLLSNGR